MRIGRRPQRTESSPSTGAAMNWPTENPANSRPIVIGNPGELLRVDGSSGIMMPNPMRLTKTVRKRTTRERGTRQSYRTSRHPR